MNKELVGMCGLGSLVGGGFEFSFFLINFVLCCQAFYSVNNCGQFHVFVFFIFYFVAIYFQTEESDCQ